MNLTSNQLQAICPSINQGKAQRVADSLNAAFTYFKITSNVEIAMIIAQLAHESASFYYVRELASGKAYEGRKDLGNTQQGDGVRFKGRSWIQITGRANYQALSDYFGVDFIKNPAELEQDEWSAKASIWFWKVYKNLGQLTTPNTDVAFVAVTEKINGGRNGLDDRRQFWARAKKALNV